MKGVELSTWVNALAPLFASAVVGLTGYFFLRRPTSQIEELRRELADERAEAQRLRNENKSLRDTVWWLQKKAREQERRRSKLNDDEHGADC